MMPNMAISNGARRHSLVNPSFLAAEAPFFRRALSVGVTFLRAKSVDPDTLPALASCRLAAGSQQLAIPFQPSFQYCLSPVIS